MATDQAQRVLGQYQDQVTAEGYARLHRKGKRHRREVRCIRSALDELPPPAVVLDLPCGAGRMFHALAETGAEVVGADASPFMVERALDAARHERAVREVRVENAFSTSFEDGSFDLVVCNRLLHHFPDSGDRRALLAELARVSRDRVLFSFFCSHSLDAFRTRLRRRMGRPCSDRTAVGYARIYCDAAAAGLRIERVLQTLPGISQQWYVVARRSS